MSIMVASGRGAGAGVLFKNAEAIEVLRDVDVLVVDKTGTLTEGRPVLVQTEVASGWDVGSLLELAASLERGSEHPLAGSIVGAALERELELYPVEDFDSRTGRGVIGKVKERLVAVGNRALLGELGVEPGELEQRTSRYESAGTDRHVRRGRRAARGRARGGRSAQGIHKPRRSRRCTRRVCAS